MVDKVTRQYIQLQQAAEDFKLKGLKATSDQDSHRHGLESDQTGLIETWYQNRRLSESPINHLHHKTKQKAPWRMSHRRMIQVRKRTSML